MNYLPQTYFDLSSFKFKDIFEGCEHVWDAILKIKEYSNQKLVQGNNCSINPSAHIREGVILGDNVIIGHGVELKNCIILDNTSISHLNYIGDSVIGSNVNIAGGVICANIRLDKNTVTIKTDEAKLDTKLEKFSCIIGDGSSIGANSVLNPGTVLGKKSVVYPLTSVRGVYKESSIIHHAHSKLVK